MWAITSAMSKDYRSEEEILFGMPMVQSYLSEEENLFRGATRFDLKGTCLLASDSARREEQEAEGESLALWGINLTPNPRRANRLRTQKYW